MKTLIYKFPKVYDLGYSRVTIKKISTRLSDGNKHFFGLTLKDLKKELFCNNNLSDKNDFKQK